MRIEIFTLFPTMFDSPLQESILKRAQDSGRLKIGLHNIRDYTTDRHHTADDEPYGGGGGMVMKPEPIFAAVEAVIGVRGQPAPALPAGTGGPGGLGVTESVLTSNVQPAVPIILLTPQGRPFTQRVARELAQHARLALICGRYEGVDERVRVGLATDEISIGDFVVTGGELPAMIVVDAVARLLPGVLGDPEATEDDSHAAGLLEYPHYTRPPEFRGHRVPEVLVSGDHARIERWRREQSLRRTWERRPDLLARAELSEAERRFVAGLADEHKS